MKAQSDWGIALGDRAHREAGHQAPGLGNEGGIWKDLGLLIYRFGLMAHAGAVRHGVR